MVARLCNAGIAVTKLQQLFAADRKTIKRWADALKSNDADELIRVLAGRGAHRKLTLKIRGYVKMRFQKIYAEDRKEALHVALGSDMRFIHHIMIMFKLSCKQEWIEAHMNYKSATTSCSED